MATTTPVETAATSQSQIHDLFVQTPKRLYFKYACAHTALTSEMRGKKRCLIVTDKPLHDLGVARNVSRNLTSVGVESEIFYDIESEPSMETISRGLRHMHLFKPDVILGLGGGSAMDVAKLVCLLYDHPELEGNVERLYLPFAEVRKVPPEHKEREVQLVCIPTTSGTGSEVTPFAVLTDQHTGEKHVVSHYSMIPDMAVCDPEFTLTMPPAVVAATGFDALTHGIESFVSTLSSPFTTSYSMQSIEMICKYVVRSFNNGKDQEARENVHYAAANAGIAFANAFLGLCHSCSYQLGTAFHIPHGVADAIMLPHIILYNSAKAQAKYAEIADHIKVGEGKTPEEKVKALVEFLEDLKTKMNIPKSLKEFGVTEEVFAAKLDEITAKALADQFTAFNPRMPVAADIKALFSDAFNGKFSQ